MHVYTMGTRAYAEAVCAAIDPKGTIFRDRILSRDESGSTSVMPSSGTVVSHIYRRFNTEELATIIPMRHVNGCHHRRSRGCLGMESELDQSSPM